MVALSKFFVELREDEPLFPRIYDWETSDDRWRYFGDKFDDLDFYQKLMAYEYVVKEVNDLLKDYADRAPDLFEKVKESKEVGSRDLKIKSPDAGKLFE